jgi:hypothetical protein
LQIHVAQTQYTAQHPESWSHTMWQVVCAYMFSLLMLRELYACGNMDLNYEGGQKTVVTSAVPPYISNYQTFLFSFLGNMSRKLLWQRNKLILWGWKLGNYFVWFLHIPYQDMDVSSWLILSHYMTWYNLAKWCSKNIFISYNYYVSLAKSSYPFYM